MRPLQPHAQSAAQVVDLAQLRSQVEPVRGQGRAQGVGVGPRRRVGDAFQGGIVAAVEAMRVDHRQHEQDRQPGRRDGDQAAGQEGRFRTRREVSWPHGSADRSRIRATVRCPVRSPVRSPCEPARGEGGRAAQHPQGLGYAVGVYEGKEGGEIPDAAPGVVARVAAGRRGQGEAPGGGCVVEAAAPQQGEGGEGERQDFQALLELVQGGEEVGDPPEHAREGIEDTVTGEELTGGQGGALLVALAQEARGSAHVQRVAEFQPVADEPRGKGGEQDRQPQGRTAPTDAEGPEGGDARQGQTRGQQEPVGADHGQQGDEEAGNGPMGAPLRRELLDGDEP